MTRKYSFQLLLLSVFLLFQSCDPEIMNDRRILVKGNIVDSDNNPVDNISVRCESYNSVLGETVSDANGQFQFTSLLTEENYSYNIVVNVKEYSYYWGDDYYWNDGYNSGNLLTTEYSAKRYFNNSRNRNTSLYDLGVIQLNKVANLSIFFNNIPGDNNVVAYKLEYDSALCQIDLNTSGSEDCQVMNDYYDQLDVNSTSFQTNLESQLGTNVIFKYILNNEPEQTITIPLSNTENTYVFEY